MEFNKVAPDIPEVVIDTSAASKHVAEVERRIRVVKEICRACMSVMSFKKIPNIMTTFLCFLAKCHASKIWNIVNLQPQGNYMPSEIDAKNWCKLMFGDYVEVHEENPVTNSMSPRTRPAICMGPTGNKEGLIKFK